MKSRNKLYITAIVILSTITVFGGFVIARLNNTVENLESNLSSLNSSVSILSTSTQNEQSTIPQMVMSQEQILTKVVANSAPAVVSVVVSRAVPQLDVEYVNPFGKNSPFGDIGIQIPVYRNRGNEVQQVGAGTGFLVTRNGHIVTNRHVVDDLEASYTVLLSNGDQRNAEVIYRDKINDVAILKIPGTYESYVNLGDSSKLSLGQSVIAIGNALGEYNNSVSVGIVSGLNRSLEALDPSTGQLEVLEDVIQTDAAINRGNSGGPLLDLSGNVIGISVATVTGSNSIGFAIPINAVKNTITNAIR